MTTLAESISATDNVIVVSGDEPEPGSLIRIGDEVIQVQGLAYSADHWPPRRMTGTLSVRRGVDSTDAATHDSGATVSVVQPVFGASAFSAGGGVTVDNQDDPPTSVMTLIAPGAAISDSEADLSEVVSLRRHVVVLTHADILAIDNTPFEIVPAAGEGKALDILRITLLSDIAVPYTNISSSSYWNVTLSDNGQYDVGLYLNETTDLGITNVSDIVGGDGFVSSGPGMGVDSGTLTTQPAFLVQPSQVDNAAAHLNLNSGGAGPLAGGDEANTIKVSTLYAVIDLA